MSIPAWRKVEYTDDGCSIYECLSCYNSWEARTSPEWSGWQFCPCCGVGWESQIKDEGDKTLTRRHLKYSQLDRDADVTLEVKHYNFTGDGEYEILFDWKYVSYGMQFYELPSPRDERYKDAHEIYKEYIYQLKIAKSIKDLAKAYSDDNSLCSNFFMFSKGYELRFAIVSRISGETKHILLTDGIVPVIRKIHKKD